jgi:hypothetical protein
VNLAGPFANSTPIASELKAHIFSNPTKDQVQISLQNGIITQVHLFDAIRRLIYQKIVEGKETSMRLSLENCENGLCFLEIRDSKGRKVIQKLEKLED